MKLKNIQVSIIHILLVPLYSYFYIYIIPWDDFAFFSDIENYLSRIEYLAKTEEEDRKGLSQLTSEPLWKYILIKIGGGGATNYNHSLYLTSFLSLSIYFSFTLKKVPAFFVIFFFFNPIFIELIMGQLRISLAFSFLILAFFSQKNLAIPLVLASMMIHATSILFFSIYLILQVIQNFSKQKIFFIYSMILALFLALFLKYGVDSILVPLGDRRANYSEVISGNSIAYSIFWFFIAIVLVMRSQYDILDKKINLIRAFSIVMTSLFFFSSAIGSYGQRYVAISIPLIIISINALPKKTAWSVFFIFGVYQLIQIFYWFSLYKHI